MAKGRPKGSPNKATLIFRDKLDEAGFSIPEKAMALFDECRGKPMVQVRILELMASYTYPKPKPVDEDGNTDDGSKGFLMGIPSEVLIQALRTTQEKKEKPA